ncbi:MAG: SDR family oxidoreductase [Myxococcales bacterium]|nr:SDR family oxidoreductase [Myxococcales bacterium]
MSESGGSLSGRRAVITGGGRGIGAAVAKLLVERGAHVLVTARSEAQVERVAAALRAAGGTAFATACDVSDEDSVAAMAAVARDRLGGVDILVNNAGIAKSHDIKRVPLEDWQQIMAVNATGPFLCTRAFVTEMLERRWGRVVNVASVTSRVGTPYIAAYTASKHAVLGFSRSVAAEVKAKGVTVNCVCPGYVNTEMTDESISRVSEKTGRDREESLKAILATVGQHRLIEPEEVAFMVANLCEERAGGTTGQAIVMDAGGFIG